MRPLRRFDDTWHRWAPSTSIGTGRVLLRVSRAADKSKLWLATAVLLAVTGDRFGRRAALRGLGLRLLLRRWLLLRRGVLALGALVVGHHRVATSIGSGCCAACGWSGPA